MAFAQETEGQGSGHMVSTKSKQKGRLELEGLRTSINYDKDSSQKKGDNKSNRSANRGQGVMLVSK